MNPSIGDNLFDVDGNDYSVLVDAVQKTSTIFGSLCEIGVRRGGSTKLIIDTVLENHTIIRNLLCLDPWGSIEYHHGTGGENWWGMYPNKMRDATIAGLYSYVRYKPINLVILPIEDSEFYRAFHTEFPFYREDKREESPQGPYIKGEKVMETKWSLVFVDGQHDFQSVLRGTDYFLEKVPVGGMLVYDNTDAYPHGLVDQKLKSKGWELAQQGGGKISYIKS